MPPSLRVCSASSIRGADMPALVSAGVTKEQLLAVWSANADTGFTPAQLKEAGVTIAEMRSHGLTIAQIHVGGISIADLRSGGVADYLVFNEACNTSSTFCTMVDDLTMERVRRECTADHPTITLTTTTLSDMDTAVVLRGETTISVGWRLGDGDRATIGFNILNSVNDTKMLGSATIELIRLEGNALTSTLSIPLADVFSNPTVTALDSQERSTSINLCPGS